MVLIIKHVSIEGPGLLGSFLKREGFKSRIIDLSKGDKLPSLDKIQAVISLGGPMNVYETDKFPFLEQEDIYLKEVLKRQIPFLGICLGAQLLAKACQATVKKAPAEEIGWFTIYLTPQGRQDSLFCGLKQRLEVFQWHHDTFEIPPEGVHLGRSTLCENQAFRIGRSGWGLQFHPEMTEEMLKEWFNYYSEEIDREKILSDYRNQKNTYWEQAKTICLNFANLIREKLETKV